MKTPRILVVGDVMLDHYLWGAAERISPEAPVPVVNISRESYSLGGAANVANNLLAMGAHSTLLGALGKDRNGAKVKDFLAQRGIDNACVLTDMQTTTKVRVVSQRHQMIRLDWEEHCNHDTLLKQQFKEIIDKQKPNGILISDYAKGVCSKSLLSEIIAFSNEKDIKILVDPKGNDWEKYRGAYMVKPNLKELEDALGEKIPNVDKAIEDSSKSLLNSYDLTCLVVTRSAKGMSVVTREEVFHLEAIPVDVFDVSGAGDTVLASLGYDLAKGITLKEAAQRANLAASKVVSKFGVVVSE